jgi:superoxide dismutase, Cu-Zn family
MAAQSAMTLHGEGALTEPNATSTAETYNPALAPVGSRLKVTLNPSDESTNAELTVSGLLPNRGYAVHAHVNACGASPELDGPHYQNRIDPAATRQAPSTNPEYANPRNEVWLDVHTDAAGSGTSRTTVPFVFTDRGPGSIVVHEAMQTATEPGQAGARQARGLLASPCPPCNRTGSNLGARDNQDAVATHGGSLGPLPPRRTPSRRSPRCRCASA